MACALPMPLRERQSVTPNRFIARNTDIGFQFLVPLGVLMLRIVSSFAIVRVELPYHLVQNRLYARVARRCCGPIVVRDLLITQFDAALFGRL